MRAQSKDEWRVVLGPGPRDVVQGQLDRWRDVHDYAEGDVRVDLIRSDEGEQLRVSVRRAKA